MRASPGRRGRPPAGGSASGRRCPYRRRPRGHSPRRTPPRFPGRSVDVDHLGCGHPGSGVAHPARHPVLVERHQCRVPEPEEGQLVPVGPDQQVDTGGGAIGHRDQRMVRQQDAVDDGKERKRQHPRIRTSLAELFGGGHELGRRDGLERISGTGRETQDGRQTLSRSLGLVERVHVCAPALHNGAPEEPFGGGRAEKRGHAESSGGLPEDGDGARITAKARNVVVHPSQGSQLILYPPVSDQPVGIGQVPVTQEAQRAQPVVDGHDHGIAVAHQLTAPVEKHRPAARSEPAPVNEDHHRTAASRRHRG